MIISRTPFRISFFGGGTDYPVWYKEHEGTTIDEAIEKTVDWYKSINPSIKNE